MMIDPIQAFKTSKILVPTHSPTPPVSPIPSVTPIRPHWERIHETGNKALWVVFVVMLISSISFAVMAFRVPVQKRLFHVLTSFTTIFATISYFAMATGAGYAFNHIIVRETQPKTGVEVILENVFRQVFWARYVDWALTTPLLLLNLGFLAGMNGADILVTVVADVMMVFLGLFAAYGKNESQRWGFYTFAVLAYLVVLYQLVVFGRRVALKKSVATSRLFSSTACYTLVLWILYIVVWGVGDGARRVSVDTEIVAYAVLDILAKPVFGFWLLFAHARNAGSVEGFWSNGLAGEGVLRVGDD